MSDEKSTLQSLLLPTNVSQRMRERMIYPVVSSSRVRGSRALDEVGERSARSKVAISVPISSLIVLKLVSPSKLSIMAKDIVNASE